MYSFSFLHNGFYKLEHNFINTYGIKTYVVWFYIFYNVISCNDLTVDLAKNA